MGDSKYFSRGKAHELKAMLLAASTSKKRAYKTIAVLKRIIANVTMGNDMSILYPDVLATLTVPSIEIKRMVFLYVVVYAKKNSDLTQDVIALLNRVTCATKFIGFV
jgi:vesicle coat complex subunit